MRTKRSHPRTRLNAAFHTSNAELYRKTELSLPDSNR